MLPDCVRDRPPTQDLRKLASIPDGPVLDAELDNGFGLFGTDARELE